MNLRRCDKCKEQKPLSEFRHSRYICKPCERLKAREWYHSHKRTQPKECLSCHKITLDIPTGKAQCRRCLAQKRKDYNLSQRTGLSQGMIALWKAGYEYEVAVKMIKGNRYYVKTNN